MKPAQLLLATTNRAKLDRLRWVVEGLGFEVLSPKDLHSLSADVPEDGADFAANADQKARAWSTAAHGMVTMASDGGLVLPGLGEAWNALRTRRNAGENASGAERIAHLLSLMRPLTGEQRRCWWHEALTVVHGTEGLPEPLIGRTWIAQGDGGLIVEEAPADSDPAFWTESIRYYPQVSKLYRDFTPEDSARLDTVWPYLRSCARAYLGDLLSMR